MSAFRGIKWRRGWDLNPRYPLRYVRFRGGSFQPLTHLSASDNKELTSKPVRSVQVHLSRPFLAPLRISALLFLRVRALFLLLQRLLRQEYLFMSIPLTFFHCVEGSDFTSQTRDEPIRISSAS